MPSMPVLLLDGGLGTCLESPPLVHAPTNTPLWSSHLLISSPETLLEVHKAYTGAGADMLLTATYQTSFEGFAATAKEAFPAASQERRDREDKKNGHQEKSEETRSHGGQEAMELMRSAVPLARKAFATMARQGNVALSLGAYGATMRPSTEYSGEYRPGEMKTSEGLARWHERRLRVFKDDATTWKDVDFVAFETLPVIQEVQAVRKVMGRCNARPGQKKWWVSCVFPNDDLNLPDGSTVDQLVEAMIGESEAGSQRPWGIGINCTSVTKLRTLVLRFETAAKRIVKNLGGEASDVEQTWPWLVIYPDGAQDLIYNTKSQTWDTTVSSHDIKSKSAWDEEVADVVRQTCQRGLWQGILVGGCCKTTPRDIERLRARLVS